MRHSPVLLLLFLALVVPTTGRTRSDDDGNAIRACAEDWTAQWRIKEVYVVPIDTDGASDDGLVAREAALWEPIFDLNPHAIWGDYGASVEVDALVAGPLVLGDQ